jgi:hypothetical protein
MNSGSAQIANPIPNPPPKKSLIESLRMIETTVNYSISFVAL